MRPDPHLQVKSALSSLRSGLRPVPKAKCLHWTGPANGQTTTSSVILYFDGVARHFREGECSGTQSSWQIDSQTIEILRNCGAGAWTRFLRRTAPKNELILEISEQRADGRRFDCRLVFEKQ